MNNTFNKQQKVYTGSDIQFLFNATVIKACYTISDEGYVNVTVKTNMDHYIRDIQREIPGIKIIYPDTVGQNDILNIYTDSKYNAVYMQVAQQGSDNRLDTKKSSLTHCPVCGELLLRMNNNSVVCLNSVCPAKLIVSIRKYLCVATYLNWKPEELIVFNKLVTVGRVKCIADIYKVSLKELESLDPCWFSYKEKDAIYSVYSKINRTRGTVSIYNYLKSLMLPNTNCLEINEKALNKLDLSISTFLELLANTEDNKLSKCMSKSTIDTLRVYFNVDSNLDNLLKLVEEDVFDD